MKQFFTLLIGVLYIAVTNGQNIIYVDSANTGTATGNSWSTAYPHLQDALETAQPGNEIWVAKGTYIPTKDKNDVVPPWGSDKLFMMRKDVKIYGGFSGSETALSQRNWRANKSILSGRQPNTSLHSETVIMADSIDSMAALDGFYITGGVLGGTIPGFGIGYGGGICLSYSNPNLSNLVIHHNKASRGAGIGMYKSDPLMVNLSIIHNNDGGGVYLERSDAKLLNCLIANNHSNYTGPACGLSATFSSPTLINVTIARNTANPNRTPYAIQNIGLPNDYGTPVIKNSIIDGWTGSIAPSAIFFYNTALKSAPSPWDTLVGVDGGGNTGAYMIYTDATNGNFRVEHCNASIDAGNNQYLLTDVLDLDYDGIVSEPMPIDLDGNPRIVNSATDIGAYEGFSPIPSDTIEAELCLGSTLTINGNLIKKHGYHLITYPNGIDSCDRRVYYDVHSPIEPVIVVDTTARFLKASIDSAQYQWYDCTNKFVLPGDTGQVFSPWIPTSYSVIVTKDGCTDTSECVTVSKIGLLESTTDLNVKVFPNPSEGMYYLHFSETLKNVELQILDLSGQVILEKSLNTSGNGSLDISDKPAGIYIIKVFAEGKANTFRLVKN